MHPSYLATPWILVESGNFYSIITTSVLGFSSKSTGAYFAAALGQISVRPLSPSLSLIVCNIDILFMQALLPNIDHCADWFERIEGILGIHTRSEIP